MTVFCRQCGKEVAEGQHFCKYCGTEVAPPVPASTARLMPDAQVPPAQDAPVPRREPLGALHEEPPVPRRVQQRPAQPQAAPTPPPAQPQRRKGRGRTPVVLVCACAGVAILAVVCLTVVTLLRAPSGGTDASLRDGSGVQDRADGSDGLPAKPAGDAGGSPDAPGGAAQAASGETPVTPPGRPENAADAPSPAPADSAPVLGPNAAAFVYSRENSQQLQENGYVYINARFGFTVTVPDTFVSGETPANDDGRRFYDPAQDMLIEVFGSLNVLEKSTQELYEQMVDALPGTVDYQTSGKDWFAASSLDGAGQVHYVKGALWDDKYRVMLLTYPQANSAVCDDYTTSLEKSFSSTKS